MVPHHTTSENILPLIILVCAVKVIEEGRIIFIRPFSLHYYDLFLLNLSNKNIEIAIKDTVHKAIQRII